MRCATDNKNNLNIVINFSNDIFRPKYKTKAVKKAITQNGEKYESFTSSTVGEINFCYALQNF